MLIIVGSGQSTMSPLGSVVLNLGSTVGSCCSNRGSVLSVHGRRVSFYKAAKFRSVKKWGCLSVSVCRYSVVDRENDVSVGSSTEGGSKDGGGGDGGSEMLLKPSPRPVVKPSGSSQGVPNVGSPNGDVSRDDEKLGGEERDKVIASLDEVLEKAEKLETKRPPASISRKESGLVEKSAPINSTYSKSTAGGPVIRRETRKTNTLKNVWRKGDAVATVPKVVAESPKPSKLAKEEPKTGEEPKVNFQADVSLEPPQPLMRPQPKLQAKPSAAPTPVPKKPVLKDVGALPKTPADSGSDPGAKTKERKPILIDKFAAKKPAVDPVIAQAILPRKPGKGPPSGKFKGDYRKKSGAPGGARRRFVDDDEMADEETSVSFPGAARKGRKWSKASRKAARLKAAQDAAPVKMEILEVEDRGMLIEDLAYNLATSEGEILGLLYSKGIKPDGVQTLDKDIVKMICREYEVEVIDADPVNVGQMAKKREIFDEEDLDKLEDRPPVITIMGHVDHGKTTLLDYIRKAKVAASEAGGITQGIGAYKVLVPMDGKLQSCVFLDTPGHEAFGAMRARGARVTDIAVIVVAADDGIRPQTNEAIAHAKAAGVPIVIALNKIDKDGASADRVMQELSSIGLMPEEWGGDIPMVKISALKGENVDELLETVMLVAELQELKANPHRNAKGTVIEAGLDKSKGPVTTFIVQNGTLKKGDIVVCGEAFGKARALFDEGGKQVDEAGPSIPVQVIGLNNVPIAGDEFEVVDSLDLARERAEIREEALRNEHISSKAEDGKITLSSFASAVSAGKLTGLDLHQLNIILKVDLQGSIEAVRQALQGLPQDNVTLKFLLQAAGDVTTSDVDLAVASNAIILGFNVKSPGPVKKYADNKGVEVRLYRIIYELIDDVRKAMEGLLEPVEEQVKIGSAEVRATFSSGSGRVAGCMVTEGKVEKGCGIRVVRKGKTTQVGILESLKRVKEVVKEVNAGLECGIGMEDYDDWQEGDIIEAFSTIQKHRTLEEASASMAAALEKSGVDL